MMNPFRPIQYIAGNPIRFGVWQLVACALGLLVISPLLFGQDVEEDPAASIPDDFRPFFSKSWLETTSKGKRDGHFHIDLEVGEWKKEKKVFHLELSMRTENFNGVIHSWTEHKYFQAAPPYLLVGYKRVEREQGSKISRTIYEGVKNGDKFDVTTTLGRGKSATKSEYQVAASRETLRDYLTVQILISTGKLSERDERTIYEFQVIEGKDHTIDLKIQRMRPQFMQGVDAILWRVWARHRGGDAREVPFYAYFDQKGQLVSYGDPDAGGGGRRVSEDWVRSDRMNPSLYFSRIPVSGSRAVPGQIHRLLLQIMNSDILVPTEDAPGLKVHRISPFNTLVELSALEWESGEEGEGPTQGEWLESENEVQSDHPDIQKAVEVALSAVEMDRRTDNLRALLNWLNKNVLPSYRPEITDALGALKAGAAGGPGRTALFTALARAAGIPARRVAGLVHRDGYLSYNEWAEVWHGGWRPVDPGRGALHLSGEYMRLAVIGEQFDLYRTLDVPQALKVQLATLGGTFQDVLLMEDGGVLFGQNEASGDGLLFRTETMEILFPLNYGEMRELSPDGIFKAMNRVVQLGRYSVYLNHEIGISFERPSGGWVMQATEKSGGLPANQGPLVQLSHRDNRQLLIALHSDPAGHPTEMYGQHITGQVMSSEPGGQLSPKQWLQISKSNRGVLRYEAFLPASRERGVPERTALHYFMKVGGCNLWLRAVASKGEATQLMEKAINEILASFRTIPKVKVPRR